MPLFPDEMPRPVGDVLTQPYWTAARDHRLVIQQCTNCGSFRHLPHELCASCRSPDHDWVESAGRGRVFTYTIVGHSVHEATASAVPYNVVVVELDDCGGVLLPGNVIDVDPGEITIGLPVEVTFDDVADDVTVVRFRAADRSR